MRLVSLCAAMTVMALLLALPSPRRAPALPDAIYLPLSTETDPLLTPDPASSWLSSLLYPRLLREQSDGSFVRALAAADPRTEHHIEISAKPSFRLPDGTQLSVGTMVNFLSMIYAKNRIFSGSRVSSNKKSFILTLLAPDGSPWELTVASVDRFHIRMGPFHPSFDVRGEFLAPLGIAEPRHDVAVRTTLNVTFLLRKDLRREDSGALTARDIADAIERLQRRGSESPLLYRTASLVKVDVHDDFTLTLTFDRLSHNARGLATVGIPISIPSLVPVDVADGRLRNRLTGESAELRTGPIPITAEKIAILGVRLQRIVGFNLRSPKLQPLGLRRRLALAVGGDQRPPIPPCRLRILVNAADAEAITLSNELAEKWAACGVILFVDRLPARDYLQRLKDRDFEIVLATLPSRERMDLFNLFHSSQSSVGGNIFGYSNAEADRMIELLDETFDETARKRQSSRILEKIREDIPCVMIDNETPLLIGASGSGKAILQQLMRAGN